MDSIKCVPYALVSNFVLYPRPSQADRKSVLLAKWVLLNV